MKNRLISGIVFIAYSAILIKLMVLRDVPLIRIGHLMLNFGGADANGHANFVPFKTIVPYIFGFNGWIIAGINLFGNIGLLVPLGFLVPFVFEKITWKKTLVLAVATGLFIESMQAVLHTGIFDIDDVILNALGVMIGYFAFSILAKWMSERKYKNIIIAAIVSLAIGLGAFYFIYPHGQPVDPEVSAISDLCNGTGGIGQIVNVGNNSFTIKRKDDSNQIVILNKEATIRTSAGVGSVSDLKTGESVTLIGDANPDGGFSANAVFVCNV